MADMDRLITLFRELEDQLVVCMKCGMCQSVCPLYAETGREADVARGKIALLEGLRHQILNDPFGVSDRLNRCLLCGSCAANCPSGVSALEIFIKARAILSGFVGLSPVKKAIFKGILARPKFFNFVTEWGSKFQKLFTKPVNDLLGTSCARISSPLLKDRHFKTLAKEPFHRTVPSLNTPPGKSGIKVALFVGCLIDKLFPNIAMSTLAVLSHHEVGILIPPDQGCCGIPAISSGDLKSFNELVKYNMDKFDPDQFDFLVTSCATCTSTIKKIWPMMFRSGSENEKKRVASIAEKTMDINQFLVSKLHIEPKMPTESDATIVSYHDPCHLKKSLGVSSEPRTLIQANPKYRLIEMAESDRCCGLGGSFNIQYYELSSKIGSIKQKHIQAAKCQVLATGCPACMIQFSDILSRTGNKIAIKHPVQLYAETLIKE